MIRPGSGFTWVALAAVLVAACAQTPQRAAPQSSPVPAERVPSADSAVAAPASPMPVRETAAVSAAVPPPAPSSKAAAATVVDGQAAGSSGTVSPAATVPRAAPESKSSPSPAAPVKRTAKPPAATRPAAVSPATSVAQTPASPAPAAAGAGALPDAYREAARRASAVGDLAWADYYYRQHLSGNPRDVEALSELGALHYRAGDRQRAASYLYDAARLLIERGNRARATRLVPMVAEGNPGLGNDLYLRLAPPASR